MALVLKDRVKETTTTTGTGAISLSGAVSGYQAFSTIGDGNTTYYTIVGGTQWETGVGTYATSGNTLSRTTFIASSTGSIIDFAAGSKDVFISLPATKLINNDTGTLEVAHGGTGAANASGAQTNLGLVIGTDVQAYNSNLTTWAGKTAPSGTVVGTTDTQTLTNKRVTQRINNNGATTSGTITPSGDSSDQYELLGLDGAVTVATPSGTPTAGQKLILRLKDNGSSQSLTWTTTSGGYRVIGTTLPATTTAGKVTYVGCVYNNTDTYWDVVAVTTQA